MERLYYIPKTIFGIPLEVVSEPCVDQIPRLYTKDFLLLRAKMKGFSYSEFCIVASAKRPELKKALKLVERIEELTDGLFCVICSPDLDFHQKELLTSRGVSFIQNDRNMFIPFLGTQAYHAAREMRPKKLSPQAQRIVLNLVSGTWINLSAGDLAKRTERKPGAISGYLSEIAAISPSLIEADGRNRILKNPGFTKEEILNRFEPYFTTPVKRSFKIGSFVKELKHLGSLGFLLAGDSALEVKTDLAFNPEKITLMITEDELRDISHEHPGLFDELPWWHESDIEVQVWKYPVDFLDPRGGGSLGIKLVDDFSLYLSLKDTIAEDVRTQDALEQVRREACQ